MLVTSITPVNTSKKKLVVIVGPTAVGKTALAIWLAKRFETEIISADSRQIFRELTIGTAKPDEAELSAVKHHFINTHSITDQYDAAQYGADALKVIHDLFLTHGYVIMAGGSGLYVRAVCEGFDDIPEIPEEIREQLTTQYEAQGLFWLQQKMLDLDPEYYATIDQKNPQRLMRALEVRIGTGKSIATFQQQRKRLVHPFEIIRIGVEDDREQLYERIDSRMDNMIAAGLFEEAKELYPFRNHNALQTVGYQEIMDYLDGKYDREEAIRLLKRNSRRYAKRQLTWFRRDTEVHWFRRDQESEIISLIMA